MGKLYLAKNLKLLRVKFDVSQAELASQMKRRDTSVSSWEREASQPDYEDLRVMSNFFRVSVDDLLYTDLENVPILDEKDRDGKKVQNVPLNVPVSVPVSVPVTGEKSIEIQPSGALEQERLKRFEELERNNRALGMAIEALTKSNAILTRDVEKLESVIRLMKGGIPEVGSASEKGQRKAAG